MISKPNARSKVYKAVMSCYNKKMPGRISPARAFSFVWEISHPYSVFTSLSTGSPAGVASAAICCTAVVAIVLATLAAVAAAVVVAAFSTSGT